MKVELKSDGGFKPIVLTITLETLGEARAMYHIFNYVKNADLIGEMNALRIAEALVAYSSGDPINNNIYHADYYRARKGGA